VGCVELVAEVEYAMRAGFGGVEVVFGMFEWGEFFDREVFWEAFDREAGKIVGHSIQLWGASWRVLIPAGSVAD